MSAGLSIREFARRDGCDDALVRRALKQGRLKAFDDGSLDEALVGSDWRRTNRRADTGADKVRTVRTSAPGVDSADIGDDETPEQAATRIIALSGATMDVAEAERVKENYLALLRQLEYDQKSGAVVPIADVARVMGEAYAQVRTRLLSIPAEHAPRLHRLKTVAELEEGLRATMTRALGALMQDGDDALV